MAKKVRGRARRAAGDGKAKTRTASPDLPLQVGRLEDENRRLRARVALLEGAPGGLPEKLLRLAELTQEFNTLDLDKLGDVATSTVPTLMGARLGSLYLYDYGTHELILLAHNQKTPLTERVSLKHHKDGVMAHVLRTREILFVEDLAEYERSHAVRLERPFADKYLSHSCIVVPLQTANFIVGVLNLADKEGRPSFVEAEDLPVVDQAARMLAMAIRNCRLFREVQNQAHTDALTKLGNYRAFHESLRSEMHRAMRYGRPLGLIMLDVDSFKELNDRYGHQAGDHALSELGHVIRNAIRREDLGARYGGDEIAIVLPETKPNGCLMVVQRLMAAVRAHDFSYDGKKVPVSISVGVATFRPEMSISEFVGAADAALYRAKQSGRNRYEMAEAPAAPK